MSDERNGTGKNAEKKLLGAVAPHLKKLSDEKLDAAVIAMDEILAEMDASHGSGPASSAKRLSTRAR